MARDVDLNNLSEDDLAYVQDRPWLVREAEFLGIELKVSEGTDEDDDEDVDYNDLTVAELQEELKERDLPTSGKKDELVARLEEDDNSED